MKETYLNGWTRESMLAQLERRNGWEKCMEDDGSSCVYLSADGRTCAAGAFFPETEEGRALAAKYDELTGLSVLATDVEEGCSFFPLDLERMGIVQTLHDKEWSELFHNRSSWNRENVESHLDAWEAEDAAVER